MTDLRRFGAQAQPASSATWYSLVSLAVCAVGTGISFGPSQMPWRSGKMWHRSGGSRMTKRLSTGLILSSLLLGAAPLASAHHSVAGQFDVNKTVTL